MARSALVLPLLVISAISLLITACAAPPLITDLRVSPAQIFPNGQSVDDRAEIAYRLTASATTSITLQTEDGQLFILRQDQRRPPGQYVTTFSGAVDGRVLPDGRYQIIVAGATEQEVTSQVVGNLEIANGDQNGPRLERVSAYPSIISPFDPERESQTQITYRLTKEAEVSLLVQQPNGTTVLIMPPTRQASGEHAETWDGVVRNRILPDGTYPVILRAVDRVGNTAEATTSVTLVETQPPDARITSVRFTPTQVIYGDVVRVEITVKNTGPTVLKTLGPDPGFTYTTRDTFASVAGGRYASQRNRWRVSVDWAGGLGPEGERYPYRWGLGHDLAPGEETTVVGYLRIMERYPEIWLYAGLVREGIGYHVNRVGQQMIKVSY